MDLTCLFLRLSQELLPVMDSVAFYVYKANYNQKLNSLPSFIKLRAIYGVKLNSLFTNSICE
jgi:hypothetical protein